MLNPFAKVQLAFVLEHLKPKTSNERKAMFDEIRKVYCINCGYTILTCNCKVR